MSNTFTALAYHRKRYIKQRRAGYELRLTEYGFLLRCAMQPTLHTLAQRESDLRVVAAYRALTFFYS